MNYCQYNSFAILSAMICLYTARLIISMIFNEFYNKGLEPSIKFAYVSSVAEILLYYFLGYECLVSNVKSVVIAFTFWIYIIGNPGFISFLESVANIIGAVLGLTLYRIGFR